LAVERHARAGAEAASLAKDEFLAMLSHELRNPIAAVSAAVHVLSRSAPLEGPAAHARDVVARQTMHLARLVDGLLDVTRLTTGKIALNRQPASLAAAVTRSLDALTTAGRTSDHDVAAATEPVWVDGDATRLEQIVTNLVDNALKYTPEGGVIRIAVAHEAAFATLRVADTGVGIAPELLPRVFDLFAQGERGLDRGQGGLGIGLTVVKRLVELHGGSVGVRSSDSGSEFLVRLPAIAEPASFESDRTQPAAPAAVPGPAQRPRRVLIVEDQADSREIMRIALESAGHVVFEAADGVAALEAARRFMPDAAFVDIGLPIVDGYEVARRIRAMPNGLAMLLVAVTGYGQPEDRRRAEAAGF